MFLITTTLFKFTSVLDVISKSYKRFPKLSEDFLLSITSDFGLYNVHAP